MIVTDKPWKCINCKTPARDDQERCTKCGDRLKVKPRIDAFAQAMERASRRPAVGVLRSLETRYAGCRFRSRLEARWAVFFDAMGIDWRYEEQGFALPSGPYLPDFRLPKSNAFLEIKGRNADRRERALCAELSITSETRVALLEGDVPRSPTCRTSSGVPALMATYWIDGEERTDVWVWGAGIPAALERARSARFEHGERG